MQNSIRLALPGKNALTDTNLDHFSVHADTDNVLIKRLLKGTATITDGNPTIKTIPHNLGYIPFFVVYYFDEINSRWVLLNNQYNEFSVPQQICAADTTNLYIYNFGGHGSGSLQVAYDIFYDNMNDNTAPTITESDRAIKIARPGKNALTSKNPNDYIMHSDLNNFKILGQGVISTTLATGGFFTPNVIAHGVNITTPVKYFVFIQFPDGKTTIAGDAGALSYDESKGIIEVAINPTNFYFYNFGSSVAVKISFIIYGTGKDNTVDNSRPLIAVAAPGKDVNNTNPENFNFHSKYPTLKYYQSGQYSMTVNNTTVQTIAHNLGYTPFFIGFVNDLAGIIASNAFAILPYYWARSSIAHPTKDIASFMYADATNIYLKAFYQTNAVGTTKTFNFQYKLFKNNLGV